jgi:hypothetical protein
VLPLPDILSQGGDRERGPWPRRVIVLAVLALVAVLVVDHFPRHHGTGVTPLAVTALPGGPDGVPGPVASWPPRGRVPLNGQRPAWYTPADGLNTPISGLPGDLYGYQFARLAGGWAVQAGGSAGSDCGNCGGDQPRPVYYLADGTIGATPLGAAALVAPGATAGSVWLTSYVGGANMNTAAGTAREVASTGRALGRPVLLPPGYRIDQGTVAGLLLQRMSADAGPAYRLWRPGGVMRKLPALLAASARRLAWEPGCSGRCQVVLLNLATGSRRVVPLPRGGLAANAAFSPDGRYLALQLSVAEDGSADELAMRLDVASVTTGALTQMPGSFVSSDAMVGFGWPEGDGVLVAELSFTSKVQLASWRLGAARPAVAKVSPQRTALYLIVG